ncbi:MAG TPA: OmpA family protein, partial [Bacteroidia bacterium]|nr:OmpA family protein [Bacteroidia bacterium]
RGYSIDTKRRTAKKLSAARAKAVADYLIAHGVDKSRVRHKGMGQYKGNSGDGKRVEFVFSSRQ